MSHSPILFDTAKFLKSAPTIKECPPDHGAEVAFAGRSNAGKSSAINTLTRQTKLARTSKTPGRTQLMNFFALRNPEQRLVDLPGYGYAKVPEKMKLEWQENLGKYLEKRKCLRGLVQMMDIRHPMQPYDTMMIEWAIKNGMPVHVLLTKADKFKRGPAQNTLFQVQKQLEDVADMVSIQCFSALKKQGIEELQAVLNQWLILPEEFPNEA